jgi:hypothetical protein
MGEGTAGRRTRAASRALKGRRDNCGRATRVDAIAFPLGAFLLVQRAAPAGSPYSASRGSAHFLFHDERLVATLPPQMRDVPDSSSLVTLRLHCVMILPDESLSVPREDRARTMRKLFYTMHYTGRAVPANNGSRPMFRIAATATSVISRTVIGPHGFECDLKASDGDLVFLESDLRVIGSDLFVEGGAICFGEGGDHVLRFSTIGHGRFSKGLELHTITGTANWRIEGGQGQFAPAQGVIASNLTIRDDGELSNLHCGVIVLPER